MGLFGRQTDPNKRLDEVEQLSDEDALVQVACTDESPRVRMAAAARVRGDGALASIAKDAGEMDVRLAAVERIGSQRLLAEIIKARKNYELMGACFARITDRDVLESIAQDPGYNPTARRIAVEHFADESYLDDADKAVKGKTEGPGADAIDRLLKSYGDLRVVRAIGRFRYSEKALKALGEIGRRGGDAGGLAVEYLVRALASSNPSVQATAADELAGIRNPDLVASIVRMLDDPKLSGPIREVLGRIDTPEARIGLGNGETGMGNPGGE
ncbi:MAG: HEAT repeat domain-containing protein [Deltaproteobacteria bacterium]|nr:HEAT repeat domain-containing protein [Deltaproteobacteria bacterium]